MAQSSADAATGHAGKPLQQFRRRRSHTMATEFNPGAGRFAFRTDARLFVADHFMRFAFREEHVFDGSKTITTSTGTDT